jgi:NAD(P)-dependent dehydrogenase (short-subunit alcohol dehydrogenase family)
MSWTLDDMPDQHGRTVVVTGATSGVGEVTAAALAARGAHVVLAVRSAERATATSERIRTSAPGASLEHLPLDLADLGSVGAAAAELRARHGRIDAVVANAGIMAPPLRRTADGFELQLGVNHLGHAALVAQVLPLLLAARDPRVVVVSSTMHRIGTIDLDDLNWERTRYQRWLAYGRSKLANLLYVLELQRRLETAGVTATAVAAHPGYARTALQRSGPTMQGGVSGALTGTLTAVGTTLFGQSAARGALPQLYAATEPDLPGGSYWGPDGPGEQRGRHPAPAARSRAASDTAVAAQLWEATEAMTGVTADLPEPAA